jgi:hypothetical protein
MFAADDLIIRVRAPDGSTTSLAGANLELKDVGPLTFDDETPTQVCRPFLYPVCSDPQRTLLPPYAGRARPQSGPLSDLDLGPIAGNWVLTVLDFASGDTSTLVSWGIEVTPARPVK